MVQTRRQWNRWQQRGFTDTQSSQGSCDECSQESNQSYSFDHQPEPEDTPPLTRNNDMYSERDHCHRHRAPDNSEKSVIVPAHRRRKAHR